MGAGGMFRVAIVGAGPAGFFAATDLLKRKDLDVMVDMLDRLPTPYGLVRNGVAPDHQGIKAVTHRYAKDVESAGGRFRLFGHVEVGKDVQLAELAAHYHAVILAFGAQSNRRMGIPGEELPGVHPASVFVGWYNGHPDCTPLRFNLGAQRAVVVGVGNVALDVARVLVKPHEALAKTDMSDVALELLQQRGVQEVVLLGRQTRAQAAYTPAELEELTEIPGLDLVVADQDRVLDAATLRAQAEGKLDSRVARCLHILDTKALREPRPGHKSVRLRFLTSPVEVQGQERVEGLVVRRNRPVERPDGTLRLEPTDEQDTIPCGLVFRAIGYKVEPLAGVPFDDATGTVPHRAGQVLDAQGAPVPGMFVTGWAKRGPQGVIGTNKPDAVETVASVLAARAAGTLPVPAQSGADLAELLKQRNVQFVSFSDWKLLDQVEVRTGAEAGRPRRKFTDVATLLEALGQSKMSALPHAELVGPATPG